MRAVTWTNDGTIAVAEVPDPEPGRGWVRVRVASAGICGSDLHAYRRRFAREGIPGHEVGGTIDAVGEGVDLAPGTPVAIEPVAGCGHCRHCTRQNPWHCRERQFFGGVPHGGMAEFMAVPAGCIHPLPEGVSASAGALAEPVAVAVRGIHQGRAGPGSSVVILGAGTVGLVTTVVARAAGANVFVTARHASQQAMAHRLGATVFASADEAVVALRGTDIDCVIETVGGHASTIAEAMRLASPGARIVLLGVFEGEPGLPALALTLKEVELVGSICYGWHEGRREFAEAVELLGRHREALESLVTHQLPLEDALEAFATADDKSTGSIKVHLVP
ncbi:MAG: L-idonate 5-dehydrogenase [Dehalococcoidia bacterium]